ncbi:hypothetical protein PsYK624_114920 [Phanerochaete sordida]|uniref:Uncharacterized protein n=1 Tax=Phanerochaete sordida TaxID=48140 RepID=A0A9P3LHS7_9APHY|nr:hypothetical protein PsYK624_114920 [Phanerochaete sordida]
MEYAKQGLCSRATILGDRGDSQRPRGGVSDDVDVIRDSTSIVQETRNYEWLEEMVSGGAHALTGIPGLLVHHLALSSEAKEAGGRCANDGRRWVMVGERCRPAVAAQTVQARGGVSGLWGASGPRKRG